MRVLAVAPRQYQRDTVELAQRLDMTCDTVSLETPQAVTSSGLYLYGSYELYGYPRKTAIGVFDSLRRQLESPHDCLVLSGFQASLIPEHLRQLIAERVKAGAGLILAGPARELLTTVKNEPAPDRLAAGRRAGRGFAVFDKMLARSGRSARPIPWAADAWWCSTTPRAAMFTPSLSINDPDINAYADYYHSLAAATVLWASGRKTPVQVRFGQQPGEVALESDQDVPDARIDVYVEHPDREHYAARRSLRRASPREQPPDRALRGLNSGPRW